MPVHWTNELSTQLDFYWEHSLRPRLAGLTDEEYFWEPVPGSWSVRQTESGAYTLDWSWPAPEPPPFTTIAWRLAHITGPVLGFRASNHFGDGSLTLETIRWPGRAADAIDLLEQSYTAWRAGVQALDADGLARPCGPVEGPYAEHSMATLILHINREVIHHGAEVAVLRDLYRETRSGQRAIP
ncbi:MAG: DinB family protein [Chloroflexota bacterium]